MKISELINKLRKERNQYGDIDITYRYRTSDDFVVSETVDYVDIHNEDGAEKAFSTPYIRLI